MLVRAEPFADVQLKLGKFHIMFETDLENDGQPTGSQKQNGILQ